MRNFSYILVIYLLIGCTSGKDIYSYPSVAHNNTFETTIQQEPDWLYAVSSQFIVGFGSGSTIVEAKQSALNDLKSKIVKRLGEVIDVSEIAVITNDYTNRIPTTTDRYSRKREFHTNYKPVIFLNQEGFNDFYYRNHINRTEYFIKYNITESKLEDIRKKCIADFEAKKAKIDSILNMHVQYTSISNVIRQIQELESLYYLLGEKDKRRCAQKVLRIKDRLDDISVRIKNDESGTVKLSFSINGTPINATNHVSVTSSQIPIESIIRLGHEAIVLYDEESISYNIDTLMLSIDLYHNVFEKPIIINANKFRINIFQKGSAILIPKHKDFFGNTTLLSAELILGTNYNSTIKIERLEFFPNDEDDNSIPLIFEPDNAFLSTDHEIAINTGTQKGIIPQWCTSMEFPPSLSLSIYCRDVKTSKLEVIELNDIDIRH